MENELKIITYKYIQDKTGLLSVLGLFIPVPNSNYKSIFPKSKWGWVFTIQIGWIPVGWIMVIIALIVKVI